MCLPRDCPVLNKRLHAQNRTLVPRMYSHRSPLVLVRSGWIRWSYNRFRRSSTAIQTFEHRNIAGGLSLLLCCGGVSPHAILK